MGSGLRNKLLSFATQHPRVIMFVESIGAWNYELEVELANPQQLTELTQHLRELCPGKIESIQMLSKTEEYKLDFFPIKT